MFPFKERRNYALSRLWAQEGANYRRAYLAGIRVRPFHRESAALVRLDGIDSATVVIRQVDAGSVGTALQYQPLPIGRDLRLLVDELVFGLAKECGDTGDLPVRDSHYAVLDAAASPAHQACEIAVRAHAIFLTARFAVAKASVRL